MLAISAVNLIGSQNAGYDIIAAIPVSNDETEYIVTGKNKDGNYVTWGFKYQYGAEHDKSDKEGQTR